MRIKPNKGTGRNPVKVLNKAVIQLGDDNNSLNITLHKTIRIPDNGKKYNLPPSLGIFPVYKVDDYRNKVPSDWLQHGGVFIPMLQREAMWMKFDQSGGIPKALKVGVGKINAIDGKKWTNKLSKSPQNYCTTPQQKWLDGIATNKTFIKQFVAAPLGTGHTVEHQMTGKDEFGGIQLLCFNKKNYKPPRVWKNYNPPPQPQPIYYHPPSAPYPAPQVVAGGIYSAPPVNYNNNFGGGGGGVRRGRGGYHAQPVKRKKAGRRSVLGSNSQFSSSHRFEECECDDFSGDSGGAKEMGMGVGGKMKQKILKDNSPISSWDQSSFSRVFVHIVNSEMFYQITGEWPEESTITRQTYITYGYPWLDFYDEKWKKGVGGSKKWKNLQSVNQVDNQQYYSNIHYNNNQNNNNYGGGGGNSGGLTFSGTINVDQNNVRDGNW